MVITKLLCSDIRQRAMLKMLGDHIRASDVEASSSSNFIQAIRPLIKAGFVERDGLNSYSLTGPGRILALQLREMIDAVEVLQDPFWRTHNLSSIPDHLKMKIGMLNGGAVVCPNHNITAAQDNFVYLLTHAKRVRGASSFNLSGYEDMVSEALANGAEVDLILTPAVVQTLSPENISAWQATGRFHLHVRAVRAAALAVADNTLSLGLFDEAGVYDPTQDFVCQSERAAEWGRELFEYYLVG